MGVLGAWLSAAGEVVRRGPCERPPVVRLPRSILKLEKGDKMVIARRFVSVTPAAQVYTQWFGSRGEAEGMPALSLIKAKRTKTEREKEAEEEKNPSQSHFTPN